MKVLKHRRYGIYMYPNDHGPPHCHVRLPDKSEIVVRIPMFKQLYGDQPLPKDLKQILEENIELLLENWDKLNGQRE